MTTIDPIEERIARLASETELVAPRPDFEARVMAQIEAAVVARGTTKDDWSSQILRWSKLGVVMATMAAAASMVLAWESSASADSEEALAYGMTETFE